MGDDCMENTQTQTQTQNSQIEWSQNTPTVIPTIIWGRIYSTKLSLSGRNCWKSVDEEYPPYFDLIQPQFTLGRALTCSFVMKKEVIKEAIIKNVSKQHFTLQRDVSEPLSPAILTDLSYNGTYVNGVKIGKGNSRVLDDNDEISVTHPLVKIFVFKDLLKNEQDMVPKMISQKYYISRTLGQGACGLVKLVIEKLQCTRHAMKIIKKSRMTNGQKNNLNDPAKIMNEINIMKALRHPCIISTEEVFDSGDTVYIVMELMRGGELFERITRPGRLSEPLTRFYFRQMVLAVRYLHSKGITHRDLKPENVLLESCEEETLVKITDFGLSKLVGDHSFMKTMCGTPLYLAPEVLRAAGTRSYGPQVDVWSLGVIFFVCLVGYLPFSADYKEASLQAQILQGRYRYSASHWSGVSSAARQLMRRMLTVPVARRITLDEILHHPWMQDAGINMRVERLLASSMRRRPLSELPATASDAATSSLDTASSSPDTASSGPHTAPSGADTATSGPDTATRGPDDDAATLLARTMKRALSNSFNSCEPVPKKFCIDVIAARAALVCETSDDTSSNHSLAFSIE